MEEPAYIVLFITTDSAEEARKIAEALLEQKKSACVNIISGVDSVFWWEGKVDSAKEKLMRLNPDVKIEAIGDTLTEANLDHLVSDCTLIVDAMDNLPTRYLLNKVAIENNIPFFHGAVYGFEGRAMTIVPGKSACLRCVYRGVIPEEKFPVIGVTPAVIGCIQATEAVKYIVGVGELLINKLLVYEGLSMQFTELKVKKDPNCEHCGQATRKE